MLDALAPMTRIAATPSRASRRPAPSPTSDSVRDAVEAAADFANLNARNAARLFVAATNLRPGRRAPVDAVTASACLPAFRKTVETDGEPCWDGGRMGNPAAAPVAEAPE